MIAQVCIEGPREERQHDLLPAGNITPPVFEEGCPIVGIEEGSLRTCEHFFEEKKAPEVEVNAHVIYNKNFSGIVDKVKDLFLCDGKVSATRFQDVLG